MSVSKREFSAAVFLGCLAGVALTGSLWALAVMLAALNRTTPGAGWLMAAVVTIVAAWIMRHLWRVVQ